MPLIWLMRMKRWVQHPPSRRRVIVVVLVAGVCVVLVLLEQVFGWPEALTVNGRSRVLR